MYPVIIKNWKLSKKYDRLFLENIKTGFCDYPILHSKYGVAYDRPEQIPEYVKKYIREHQFELLNK